MSADKCIKKFICTLWPLISAPLFDCLYTNINNLLDKARNIKDMKKDIVINFPKQEKFSISKSNQRLRGSTKGSTGPEELAKSATRSTDAKKTSAGANWNRLYPNSKFRLMSMKPEKWTKIWHKSQAFLKKLTDEEQITIARKKYCWSYCESKYWISDDCYLSKKKMYLNIANIEEIRSGLESKVKKA